ncbi:MAG: tetratricopeptide repeat protein [Nostoc desertorum CM1-VF14]|nr:tetratricopeptide repeat protein [Nostoc desertorum CM1-VF14]
MGILLYYQSKLEEAIAVYQKALQIYPNFLITHNNLGLALFDQDKLKEAKRSPFTKKPCKSTQIMHSLTITWGLLCTSKVSKKRSQN